MRKPKVRCDNCPAKNNRIRPYIVGGKRMDLCVKCCEAAIAANLEIRNL